MEVFRPTLECILSIKRVGRDNQCCFFHWVWAIVIDLDEAVSPSPQPHHDSNIIICCFICSIYISLISLKETTGLSIHKLASCISGLKSNPRDLRILGQGELDGLKWILLNHSVVHISRNHVKTHQPSQLSYLQFLLGENEKKREIRR